VSVILTVPPVSLIAPNVSVGVLSFRLILPLVLLLAEKLVTALVAVSSIVPVDELVVSAPPVMIPLTVWLIEPLFAVKFTAFAPAFNALLTLMLPVVFVMLTE